ncbi:putative cytochrome P450 monooxygenase [Trichoderma velutinum]
MLSVVFASLAVLGATWLLSPLLRYDLWSIPGPWWRQFTDVFQFIDAVKGKTTASLQRLHQQYGSIVRLGPDTVSISDPGMIAAVYGIRSNLPKSHHWDVWQNQVNGKLVPSILYTLETKAHGTLKRPIAGIFSMSNIAKLESLIDEVIISFVKKLDEKFISPADQKQIAAMDSWVHYFSYDAVMNMTLSRDFGFIKNGGDVEGIFSGLDTALTYRAGVFTMPWIHWLVANSPIKKFFAARMAAFQRRARALIETRMAQSGRSQDLLQQLVETQKVHPDVVNDLVLNGYVVLPVVAGADTVAIVSATVFYHLGRRPDIAANLQKELRTGGLTLPPSFSEVNSLPYLGAVVQEALRIHPISAFLSRRVVSSDAGLPLPNGRTLPRGTVVAVSPWMTHFDESVFGSDAREFNPSRWLQTSGETDESFEERLRNMKRADLSWGYGDRTCIGKNIALCELLKLIATLYSLFDIKLKDPQKEWTIKETLLTKQTGIDVHITWAQDANMEMLKEKRVA